MQERETHLAKGYDAEHDDHEDYGELAIAAAMYAADTTSLDTYIPDHEWPWPEPDKYPDKRGEIDRIRQLAIAGALCAAEIDRLLRLQVKESEATNE